MDKMSAVKWAGILLALSFLASLPGLIMFWQRAGHLGGSPRSHLHFVIERCFIMAGPFLAAIGFILLAVALQSTRGFLAAVISASGFFFGAVLLVAGETLSLSFGYEKLAGLLWVYVVLALLSQALGGVALLQSGLLAGWVGWAVIFWNIGWLVALPILSPRDLYFPVLHEVAPLLIAIMLFIK